MAELKREIGYKALLLIVINSIMGTGIFFLPAIGAKIAGPASLIAWLIISVIAIYISMCFAELTSMFPKSGGVYEFCKQAYGRFPSFIIGWTTLIASHITIAMLVLGAIQYLLPFDIPMIKVGISIMFVILFNIVAYRGIKLSVTILIAFAFITLGTILLLIFPSLFKFDISNFKPFFIFPLSAIYFAIFFIAETFFGWESPTFLAGETKDGKRVVPKALVIGTIFIAVFSLIFVISALGSAGWESFGNSSAPLSFLAGMHYGEIGISIFTILVYLSIIGSVADWIVTSPRLILAMAKDKLFLRNTAAIHHKFHTPYKAIIFQTLASIIFIFLAAGNYQLLLEMLLPILFFLYSAVLFSVVILRIKEPHIKRYFTVPFGKVGPVLVILFFVSLMSIWISISENAAHIIRNGFLFVALGIPLYFLLEMYYNPRAVRKTNNLLAYLALLTERIALPLSVRKDILKLTGSMKGKTILEFGCSVGTMTMHLAEVVGKKGRVYATDISERDLAIAQNRMDKKGHSHVKFIHDLNHHSRIHPDIPDIHLVVSIGMLGYVLNVKRVLKQMNKKLKIGNRICFVDYDKFFDLIPNKSWLSDDKKIKKIFNDCGFKVNVRRKQGFAWKYIYIYGEKSRNVK